MPTSKRRSSAPGRRSAPRWGSSLAALALLALGACAPRRVEPPPAPGDLPAREPALRVGLLVDTARVVLSSRGGLEIVPADGGAAVHRAGPGETVEVSAAPGGGLRVSAGGAAHDTPATLLLARPAGDATIGIGGKPYRGSALVRLSGPGKVTAINQLDMEEYLLGVVPFEIGKVGPELLEAAKAQAVAARTYAVRYMGRRSQLGFDVFATVQDQVYGGLAGEHEPVSRAVRETAGEILTHAGEPIEAFYHSTCAGRTAAIEEVWPQERPRPYLVSVVDTDPATGEAFDRSSNRFRWTQRWTVPELTRILNETLADSLPAGATSVGEIERFEVLERTASDRIRRMRISTSAGDFLVGGDRIRWIFLTPQGSILNSSKFDIEVVRDAQGRPQEFVATGGGWGHGIGMCQVGAMGRARAGQSYRTILQAYYPAAQLRDLY